MPTVEQRVTFSIGIAVLPDHAIDAGSLAQAADRALYAAKKAGRELLHFEERGIRARSHVEGLVHHHRHRAADNLEQRIEQTRTHVNKLATKSHSITSKIRPHMPKY